MICGARDVMGRGSIEHSQPFRASCRDAAFLCSRSTSETHLKVLHVMDGLMHVRAAVTAEASALLALTAGRHRAKHQQTIPLAALDAASDEALRRAIEALVLAAGGADRGPRGGCAQPAAAQRIITR